MHAVTAIWKPLSLVPGLGQLIKGRVLRAVSIFVVFVMALLTIPLFIGFVDAPVIWIWQVRPPREAMAKTESLSRLANNPSGEVNSARVRAWRGLEIATAQKMTPVSRCVKDLE